MIHVYYHWAAMGEYHREISAEIFTAVSFSGLYDAADSLTSYVVGDKPTAGLADPRWRIYPGGPSNLFEFPTLTALWQHAKREPDARFIYLHSKGASRRYDEAKPWRRTMLFALLSDWRSNLELLDSIDAVGVFPEGNERLLFSGNFWMARGDHIARLDEAKPDPTLYQERIGAETWILGHPETKWIGIIGGNYAQQYKTEAYRGAPRTTCIY